MLVTAPKCKSSNAATLDMIERSHKVLPLCKKVKILELIRYFERAREITIT